MRYGATLFSGADTESNGTVRHDEMEMVVAHRAAAHLGIPEAAHETARPGSELSLYPPHHHAKLFPRVGMKVGRVHNVLAGNEKKVVLCVLVRPLVVRDNPMHPSSENRTLMLLRKIPHAERALATRADALQDFLLFRQPGV